MSEQQNNDQQQTNTGDQNKPDTFSREYVEELRAEAAKHRTEKNDAVEAAKAEVRAEYEPKIEALEAQVAEAQSNQNEVRTEVDRLKATIDAGISHDKVYSFADLLKGENEDELRSHAEEIKQLFTQEETTPSTKPATDPSQGKSGDPLPLNGDPLLNAVTKLVNRR